MTIARTVITARSSTVLVSGSPMQITVTQVTTGLTGRSGSSGQAQISTDVGNQIVQGSDQRLLVPGGFDFDSLVQSNLSI